MRYEENRQLSFPDSFLNNCKELSKRGVFHTQLPRESNVLIVMNVFTTLNTIDKISFNHQPAVGNGSNISWIFLTSSHLLTLGQLKIKQDEIDSLETVNKKAIKHPKLNKYVQCPKNSFKKSSMADEKNRLVTYKNWPLLMLHPKQLAKCGFYYTGVLDVVIGKQVTTQSTKNSFPIVNIWI
ncbi:hypothetical protein TNCV_2373321 [Trichonephila clavipes]|nr:hypothetical protein TNCV_4670291 [Trichonephila clavipes]GFX40548.1 hypothetical protein TNCV_2373321 [Trichonephila clavipes]